ncbi:NtrB (modular protein) [Desulfamplus magnetovallimortis]|uniref:NtrB (Modular protein) n=1 Tax=Desulfamplus magnetovallimortis TaxID=1246637 RepID=A0A1W1H5L1_9BACT|nr:ABC transporter permease [Desulfamplus magnetovallimortis]SLM27665.1 NtrB (modular protein) [Desulfamplus magnetovallimortis]
MAKDKVYINPDLKFDAAPDPDRDVGSDFSSDINEKMSGWGENDLYRESSRIEDGSAIEEKLDFPLDQEGFRSDSHPIKSENRFSFQAFFAYRAESFKYESLGIILLFTMWMVGGIIFVYISGHEQFNDFLPVPAFKALFRAIQEDRFWFSVWASIRRVLTGITIAALIGVPLGLVTGFYPVLRNIAYAPTQFLRMISPLAWMPVALILFTSFESAICFLIAMATVWPIILNTASGVATINPQWIEMAMNQGASSPQLLRTIVIPASLPAILSSLRLALGVAWIVLVPAEFLGVASGLGYLINDARDTLEYDMLMAMIIAIGIMGFVLDKVFQYIQAVVVRSWMQ